jgi:hypothetical protein
MKVGGYMSRKTDFQVREIKGSTEVTHFTKKGPKWIKTKTEKRNNQFLNEEYWKKVPEFGSRKTLRVNYDYSVGKRLLDSYTSVSPSGNEKVVHKRVPGSAFETGRLTKF